MKYTVCLLSTLLLPPALASEPGQPLDCSDWVAVEPGFVCEPWVSPGCEEWDCSVGSETRNKVPDNEGNLAYVNRVLLGSAPDCGGVQLFRTEVVRQQRTQHVVLGYFEDRCDSTSGCRDWMEATDWSASWQTCEFDATNGQLYLSLLGRSSCGGDGGRWIAAITGFATLYEVLQTYTPSTNEISFRVPYMPDGMEAADWFDTYYGDLATVGDWSQAQGLECGYPPLPPSVGDYLTVQDPLPDPSPGTGRYYVTAVTHMGQRRYGRKDEGGQLSGRDPAVLPACE